MTNNLASSADLSTIYWIFGRGLPFFGSIVYTRTWHGWRGGLLSLAMSLCRDMVLVFVGRPGISSDAS